MPGTPVDDIPSRGGILDLLAGSNWPIADINLGAVAFYESFLDNLQEQLLTLPAFIAKPSTFWSGFVGWLTGRSVQTTSQGLSLSGARSLMMDEWEAYCASVGVNPYTGEESA